MGLNDLKGVFMSGAIAMGFIILYQLKYVGSILNLLSPYGRMGLSNYEMQNVIGCLLFSTWAFGSFFGRFGTTEVFLLGLFIYVLQVVVSRYWLKYCLILSTMKTTIFATLILSLLAFHQSSHAQNMNTNNQIAVSTTNSASGRQVPFAATKGLNSHNANPWGLVYQGAITENAEGRVNIHPITYMLNGLQIAANVYTPAGYDAGKKYPALVVEHPNGGVKEQVAGLYSQRMAEQGYICLAFDAAYQEPARENLARRTSLPNVSKTSAALRTFCCNIPEWTPLVSASWAFGAAEATP